MSYNLKNLSLKSLEKIFLVLDDIKYNMEIQNKTTWLDLGDVEGIDGVPMVEHRKIIVTLLSASFIQEKPTYGQGNCCIDVDTAGLNEFTQKVTDRIQELKDAQETPNSISKKELFFDKDASVLHINGHEIKISARDKKTVAHDILEYIFIDNCENLKDDFYYSEIAFTKFGDEKYKSNRIAWRKYHAACMSIQDKIRKQTANKIDDFLIYNASQTGRAKINQKYFS